MFITPHTAAALWLSNKVSNPLSAFTLGVASHFVLDMIPHGDESMGRHKDIESERWHYMMKIGIVDLILNAILLLIFFARKQQVNLLVLGAILFGAWLPDLLWLAYRRYQNKWLRKAWQFHAKFHNIGEYRASVKMGIAVQVIVLFIMIRLIF